MSLVFLKNRDIELAEEQQEGRPHWKWNNTFNTPLKLPPNSQVAYIQSTIALSKAMAITNENDDLYIVIGNPEINPTMRIRLPQGQPQSPAALAVIITKQLNMWGLQADYKTTESSGFVNANGYMCMYDPLTLKFNYACMCRATNTTKGVGYNRSIAGALPNYTGTTELDMITNPSIQGFNNPPTAVPPYPPAGGLVYPIMNPMSWLPPFFFNGTGTAANADIGFNVVRGQDGALLPNQIQGAAAYQPFQGAFENDYGQPNNPICSNWGMWSSKTGIKKVGLSGGTNVNTDLNEVIFGIRNNPDAHFPPIAGNECMPVCAGLMPRYWLEWGGDATPTIKDTARKQHINNVDLNVGNTNGKARYLFGIKTICRAGSPDLGKIQAVMNIGTYDNPQYTDIGTPLDITGLPTAGASPPAQTFFRFRVVNTYQFAIDITRDYDQATGGATWTKLYDMSDGSNQGAAGSTILIPSWFGDLCLVCYNPFRVHQARIRGNFDLIQSFTGDNNSDGTANQPFPYSVYNPQMFSRWGMFRTGAGNFTGSIEGMNAAGYAEKEMRITHNPANADPDLDFNLEIPLIPLDVFGNPQAGYTYPLDPSTQKYFTLNNPLTSLGYELGFGSDSVVDIDTGVPTPFEMFKKAASNPLQASKNVNSVHIQLTNLPIQSKNALIQDGVKDIAVVPCYDAQQVSNDEVNGTDIYHHQNSVKNWIDLNNIQTLYLNNLDVYLSYDNNKPATGVKEETDVLVMFRQKPQSDLSTPLNIQTIGQQNPFTPRVGEI